MKENLGFGKRIERIRFLDLLLFHVMHGDKKCHQISILINHKNTSASLTKSANVFSLFLDVLSSPFALIKMEEVTKRRIRVHFF